MKSPQNEQIDTVNLKEFKTPTLKRGFTDELTEDRVDEGQSQISPLNDNNDLRVTSNFGFKK